VSFTIIMTTSKDRVSQHNTRPARPKPRPFFLVWDRCCPKTDGLRPHHWWKLEGNSVERITRWFRYLSVIGIMVGNSSHSYSLPKRRPSDP